MPVGVTRESAVPKPEGKRSFHSVLTIRRQRRLFVCQNAARLGEGWGELRGCGRSP